MKKIAPILHLALITLMWTKGILGLWDWDLGLTITITGAVTELMLEQVAGISVELEQLCIA